MTAPLEDDVLYTVPEAAAWLGVSSDWLSRAAVAGTVPSRKIGVYRRFTAQDIREYLDSVRQGVTAPSVAGTSLSRRRRRAS